MGNVLIHLHKNYEFCSMLIHIIGLIVFSFDQSWNLFFFQTIDKFSLGTLKRNRRNWCGFFI